MSLSQKVQEIEELFSILGRETSKFQSWSGLTCKTGCAKCCSKADIEATVLDFLSFAHCLFLVNQSEKWLDRTTTTESEPSGMQRNVCLFFEPTRAGICSCTIDHDLARDFYPINETIRRAIETVLHYYAYRKQEG